MPASECKLNTVVFRLTWKERPTDSPTFLVPSWAASSDFNPLNCSASYIWPVIVPGILLFCLIFEIAHDSHLFLYQTSFCQINLDSSMSQLLGPQCKLLTYSFKTVRSRPASVPVLPLLSSVAQPLPPPMPRHALNGAQSGPFVLTPPPLTY